MKLLLTLISLLTITSTLFAAGESVIIQTQACVKFSKSKYELCSKSLRNAGTSINGFEIITTNAKLEIQSSEMYQGVDASALAAGLVKVANQGVDTTMLSFIAGPVVHAMEDAANNPSEDTLSELAGLKLRLAKRISEK